MKSNKTKRPTDNKSFNDLLSNLSLRLLKVNPGNFDSEIRQSVIEIGEHYRVDRVELRRFDEGCTVSTLLHRWVRGNEIGVSADLPNDEMPWVASLILRGEVVRIGRLSDMPAEAEEDQKVLRNFGYKALLAVPVPIKDEPWGACIIAMLVPHKWSDKTVQELQLLGVLLASALTRYLAIKEFSHRAEFQRRLAELSTSLTTALPEESDKQLNQACGRIGVDYGLDTVGIKWFSGVDGEQVDHRAGWRRAQDTWPVPLDHEERTHVPWFANKIREGKKVQIDDVGDMPDEARTDQASMQGWGISSLLGFPARVKDKIAGCCIFTSSEQRNWQEETVQELQLIADALSGAYTRLWATAETARSERDLARSQKLARIGNYSMVFETPQASFSLEGIMKLSAQFRDLFGIEAGQTSSEQVMSRMHPDDYERVLHAMEKGFMSGAPVRETYRVVRPDGTVLHLEGQHETDRDEKGNVKKIFGTVHDVTDQVQSRQEIEGALAEIEKLKDQLTQENLYLREEIRVAHGFDKIIGDSLLLTNALTLAEKVAPTDVSVLILGETGTGKELIAQAIHDLSGRKDHALISVNCAALSMNLIESELFGHEKGAFTGAHSQRKGRFELADGGTLFLDEIGDLPTEVQAKLLRVLQSGVFERLGGSTTLHVDVRLIAATNKNLTRAVDEGEFRADLYYRINSFPIEMPPLRERPEDIPALAEFLVQKHAKRMGKDIQSISARTIRYLSNQKWPGNVRELEGFIQRALISAIGPVLDYSESHNSEPEFSASPDSVPANEWADLRNVEREHILEVLESTRWVIAGKRGAATIMGVPSSTLRSMMKRLGIKRPQRY